MNRMIVVICLAGLSLGLCAGVRVSAPARPFVPDGSIVRLVDDKGRTFCSATIVSKKLVLTAAHCVLEQGMFGAGEVRSNIGVRSANGLIQSVGNVVSASSQTDQAVLTGDFSMFPARQFENDPARDMVALSAGRRLVACGYPLGGALFCTDFTVSGHSLFWIAGYSSLFPGMSGGPVIDPATGKVVAINYAAEGDKDMVTPTLEILAHVDQSQL